MKQQQNTASFKPAELKPITIRLSPVDYEALKRLADERGTRAPSLVRKAIKEILKEAEL